MRLKIFSPLQRERNSEDSIVWKGNKCGSPTARFFFKFLSISVEDVESRNWKWIWKQFERLHGYALMICSQPMFCRAKCCLADSSTMCSRYNVTCDSLIHLPRDCAKSKLVWEGLIPNNKRGWFV